MVMGVIGWMLLGLIGGYVACTLVNNRSEGLAMYIACGMIGAVTGGWLFNTLGVGDATGFTLGSLLVAGFGAVVLLWGVYALRNATGRA